MLNDRLVSLCLVCCRITLVCNKELAIAIVLPMFLERDTVQTIFLDLPWSCLQRRVSFRTNDVTTLSLLAFVIERDTLPRFVTYAAHIPLVLGCKTRNRSRAARGKLLSISKCL